MKLIRNILLIATLVVLPFIVQGQTKAGSIEVLSNLFTGKDTLNYRGVCFGHGLDSVPATKDSSFAMMPVPHIFDGKELRAITLGSMVAGDRNVTVYVRRMRSGTRTTMATVEFTSDSDLTYNTTSGIDTDYDDLATGDMIYPVVISGSGTNYREIFSVSLLFK